MAGFMGVWGRFHKSMGKGKGILRPRFSSKLRKNSLFYKCIMQHTFPYFWKTLSWFTLPSLSIPLNFLFFIYKWWKRNWCHINIPCRLISLRRKSYEYLQPECYIYNIILCSKYCVTFVALQCNQNNKVPEIGN